MNDQSTSLIAALRSALVADPRNGPLWAHLADLLEQASQPEEALAASRRALELGNESLEGMLRHLRLLRHCGEHAEALIRAEQLLEHHEDAVLRLEFARALLIVGQSDEAVENYAKALALDPSCHDEELAALAPAPDTSDADADGRPAMTVAGDRPEVPDSVEEFGWSDDRIDFDDVVGLDHVKSQIRLRIISPFENQEVFRAFGRQAGGGILLYGPPGCGKTFMARATAGECGARFVPVGIAEILDKYWGETEKLIKSLFDDARRRAPTVLFFDEFDALGHSRGRSESQFWRSLVDQLLNEMDGIAGKTKDVLVFSATNLPWNVDQAFRRPGRFDRSLFVPPPDAAAREEMLRRRLAALPGGDQISIEALVKKTELMTGADLNALAERAAERALTESLESGSIVPVEARDFTRALAGMQSSALEWFATARNHARYANEAGTYDELVDYLRRIGKW